MTAVLNWYSRKVLGWHLSNTLGVPGSPAALEAALKAAGKRPEILNTDQGSQFTSEERLGRMAKLGIRPGMDGKGRWLDNIVVNGSGGR